MKCIKEKETGIITKTYDENAHHLVNKGTHTYCSRKEWKEKVRDVVKKAK